MLSIQVVSLIVLMLDFRSLALAQKISHNPANYPNCQCAHLFNTEGQGNCNDSEDRWCYVAENVNGRNVDARTVCPDSVESSVHNGRFWSNVACVTPAPTKRTNVASSSPITNRESLEAGESLKEGQCEYTCRDTGGCTTELVVNWSEIFEESRGWENRVFTKTECASSYNNGICGKKIPGCNDCNKVIDCKPTKFPQNGIEKLVGTECFVSYDEYYDSDYGEDYYGELFCDDRCIETGQGNPCACGKMVLKGGRTVPGQELAANGIYCFDCPGCPAEPDCVGPRPRNLPEEAYDQACGPQPAAGGAPLFKSSALASTTTLSRFYKFDNTKVPTCNPNQCPRAGKCCDTIRRARGRVICPRRC